jgi:hypothetical protein
MTGTAPAPAGGTIVAGTYNLTAVTIYGAPADASAGAAFPSERETVVISSLTSTSFTAAVVQQAGTQTSSVEYTEVVSGSTLAVTQTCPAVGDAGASGAGADFTATATTIDVFFTAGSNVTIVETYQRLSNP